MDRNDLMPGESHAFTHLHIAGRELHLAAKRIRLAALVASLPDVEETITYTFPHGRVTFANGTFAIELQACGPRVNHHAQRSNWPDRRHG